MKEANIQLDGTIKITDTAMAEGFFYYGVDFEAELPEPLFRLLVHSTHWILLRYQQIL